MPNDAKLGLIVGVGLVIAIAVVFFRKDAPAAPAPAAAVTPKTPQAPRNEVKAAPAQPASVSRPAPAEPVRHVVKEGDTLFNLARQYYHDGARFVDIYRANRDVLDAPDPLTPGTVLVIPQADADE
jgi:5'-nucleotidase